MSADSGRPSRRQGEVTTSRIEDWGSSTSNGVVVAITEYSGDQYRADAVVA